MATVTTFSLSYPSFISTVLTITPPSSIPANSTTGLTCLIHQSMYSGITLTIMPKFEIEKFCSIVQNQKITFSYVVPPIVLLLAKHPIVDKYDLSSLRMMNSGAAPLTRELVERVYERLKIPVKQGYGLSETSPTTHTQVHGFL